MHRNSFLIHLFSLVVDLLPETAAIGTGVALDLPAPLDAAVHYPQTENNETCPQADVCMAVGGVEVLGLTADVAGKVKEPSVCSGSVLELAPKRSEEHVVCAGTRNRRKPAVVAASKSIFAEKGNSQPYLLSVHMISYTV